MWGSGVSVIVSTGGRPERLQLCLGALAEQTFPPRLFELIVADNGTPPAKLKKALEPYSALRTRVFSGGRSAFGYAQLLNRLIAEKDGAWGDLIVLLNDDQIPARGFVGACVTTDWPGVFSVAAPLCVHGAYEQKLISRLGLAGGRGTIWTGEWKELLQPTQKIQDLHAIISKIR